MHLVKLVDHFATAPSFAGAHLFLKGSREIDVLDCQPCTLTASDTQVAVGQEVDVTLTVDLTLRAIDLDCLQGHYQPTRRH